MTQEQKGLLLKDLCSRLPYGIKVYDTKGNFNSNCQTLAHINGIVGEAFIVSGFMCRTAPITDLKPYLFPISSMTKEQKKELDKLGWYFDNFGIDNIDEYHDDKEVVTHILCSELVDWLDKNHFDYRELIKKGLAIDATNLNIY